ncbi:hypothetical protein GW915_02825 [bacterium]|nr:hypothetical protein [bacterium]
MRSYKNIALIFFLMALTLVVSSSCGKKKTKSANSDPIEEPVANNNRNNQLPNNDFNQAADVRICPTQIVNNLSVNALEAYMFTVVEEMEGGASWCMKLYGTGKYFDAALRIEYEDNFGVRSYNLLSQHIVFSEIKDGKLHLLWLDEAGFIEVKGYRQPNSSWRARIRFANLPEQSEIAAQNVDDIYSDVFNKCKSGQYTFSQCWGTNVVYYPEWPQNNGNLSEADLLKYADEYLNGQHGADAHTLGYINFNMSDVVVQ